MEQEREPFVKYTTEEKQAFGKQFTPREKQSYRKGQRNAYSHMANTAKRESIYINSNLPKDEPALAPIPGHSNYNSQESRILQKALKETKEISKANKQTK